MKSHLLVCGAGLAFIWDAACSQPQVTDPVAQDTRSGSKEPSNIYDDLKRKYPGDVENRRQRAGQVYRDLFDTLDLSFEDAERLVIALTEVEVLTSSWGMGEIEHYEPLAEDIARADAIMADIETMLGPERFAVLTAYRDTLGFRERLLPLSEQLYSIGRPLSAEQKEQLVSVLVAEWDELEAAAQNLSGRTLEGAQQLVAHFDNDDLYLEKLFGSVLTAEQREIARAYFAYRAQLRHQALERYRQLLTEGDPLANYGIVIPADAS